MNKVRAKFRCESVRPIGGGVVDNSTVQVRLSAVTDGSEENKVFWKYTPAGTLEMQIDNPPASDLFKEGQEYYIDIQPAVLKEE